MRSEKRLIKHRKQEEEQKENIKINKGLLQCNQIGRKFTLSIAIPSSLMGKQQSRELKTYFAGQVRRNT